MTLKLAYVAPTMKLNGQTRLCTFAATQFYKAGATYNVYVNIDDPEKHPHVQGSDGHFDLLSLVISKFVDPKKKEKKRNAS